MRFRDIVSDGWSNFFAIVLVAVTVTLVMPALFGLQNFTQWGGMYDDHWCNAKVYAENPYEFPNTKSEQVTAGMGEPRVYSTPGHNRMTCLVWVRTLCKTKAKDGWTITWVEPKLQSQFFLGEENACDLSLPGTERWFFHAHL